MDIATYIGPDGRRIVRPPGLFDTPGAVCGAGTVAALLGLVFALERFAWWKRLAALGFSLAGISAIYLSHVRASLVVTIGMMAVYSVTLVVQGERKRLTAFVGLSAALVAVGLAGAVFLGGTSIRERFSTLLEDDPGSIYYSSRGQQLVTGFSELVDEYPFGAGLARWGMMRGYFGDRSNLDSTALWAEVQPNAWMLDGGVFLRRPVHRRAPGGRLVRVAARLEAIQPRGPDVGGGRHRGQRRDPRVGLHVRSVRNAGRPAGPGSSKARCTARWFTGCASDTLASRRRRLHAPRGDGRRQSRPRASSRAARRRAARRGPSCLGRSRRAARRERASRVAALRPTPARQSTAVANRAARLAPPAHAAASAPSPTAATVRSPTPTGSTTCTPRSRRRRPARARAARNRRLPTSVTSPPSVARCVAPGW